MITGIVRDRERALAAQAGLLPGQFFQFGGESGEPPDGQQVQPQQRVLPEQGLRHRREHARRDHGCALAGLRIHADHAEPGGRGPPGDRRPDDAAPGDGNISVQGTGDSAHS